MANPSDSSVQNLLPVQAYFDVDGNFQTFIGQGQPFYATPDPEQSGLHITNSTIDSSPIGATTPSTGAFTSGTVLAAPAASTDIANKQYVDYYAAGLSWKEPCLVASTANIPTLSGLLTVDTVTLAAGDRVLVKNQSTASQNGIYTAAAGAWSRAVGADDWNEYLGAITFIIEGSQGGSAWYCTAQPGGTLGTTAINWSNFSVSSSYTAGTGLTLAGTQFSITNTGVTAATYGSSSKAVILAVNAQGQITSASDGDISIAGSQITSGTIGTSYLSGNYSGITGVGTLGGLTVTNPIVGSITGNAATATTAGSATTATTATNLAGGAAGSLPYQSASGVTALLAAGTNGQVLTLASGIPSWATPTTGTVTSVSGAGTVNGLTLTGTVTSTGSLTLGGTLDLSSPPAIGGTAANTINGTTITGSTAVKSPYFDATTSAGGALRNASGTNQIQWGSGGGSNVSIDVSANLNGTNAQIDISPTGTGHVHINPSGSGSVQIAPTSAGTMDNLAIGGTTPLAGTFTTLRVNSTISLNGSTGTAGYALISNGASAPTWQAISAGLTVTDDTTTNATRYLTFTSATSGSITGINTASTELKFNPSLGILDFSGMTGAITAPAGTTAQRPATPVVGMTRWNTTTLKYEVYTGGTSEWVNLASQSTTYTVTYLAVAGGGGAGAGVAGVNSGAGGGAGGLLTGTFTAATGIVYTATIGGGGSANASSGSNSTITGSGITTVTAIGGGAGGVGPGANGSGGGSGGGANGSTSGATYTGGSGTSGQGNRGGNASTFQGSGGGGAGAAGADGGGTLNGGIGVQSSITGSAVYYAGGGAGNGGSGGSGGGGSGSSGQTNGQANTGGGGAAYSTTAGTGGSGIVIFSVPTAQYTGTVTGSPGVSTSGSNTIISFTSSGTYTG